jgi:hypothetical protein
MECSAQHGKLMAMNTIWNQMDRHGLCKHMFSVLYNEQVNTELYVNKYLYVGLFFVFSMAGCILQLCNCFKTGKFWTVEGPVAASCNFAIIASKLENSDSRR